MEKINSSTIKKLQHIFDEIRKGNFDVKLEINDNVELGSLVNSFQQMMEYLKQTKSVLGEYQRELEDQLEESRYFRSALDESSIVAITDKDGIIQYANKQFEQISKYSQAELYGKHHRIVKSDYHPPDFFVSMWKVITSGKVWKGIIKNKAKDGTHYWVKTTIVPFMGKDGKPERYLSVRNDVTKLKKMEEKLSRSLEEIKQSDKMKEEFSTMVSHELKTPLTPIRFQCEMLLEPGIIGKINNEQAEAIREIERNTTKLEQLISNMLDAQKLDIGKMVFNFEKIDVAKFLNDAKKSLIPFINSKKIQFIVNCSVTNHIISDELRLHQVLDNLVKNAVDFIPSGDGKIEINVESNYDNVLFWVRDNGIGIPEYKQKNLFKKFYQTDTSHARKHGGTGLGLVICKGIIEGLGGKIWLESKPGVGTTFYFSIPKKEEILIET